MGYLKKLSHLIIFENHLKFIWDSVPDNHGLPKLIIIFHQITLSKLFLSIHISINSLLKLYIESMLKKENHNFDITIQVMTVQNKFEKWLGSKIAQDKLIMDNHFKITSHRNYKKN
jgi:hypothetical protein